MITNWLELFKKKDDVMQLKGGVVMGKLLFVIALCLSFTALAGAYDVINIDLNGSASDPCYTGLGPFGNPSYVDVDDWNGFFTGVGVMMASPRNSGIGTAGSSATYARALYIADPCSHNYVPYTTGNELLNDGFQKTPPVSDPNPGLFFWGSMAYGGVYDVYVISDVIGAFTIKDSNGDTQSASLSGGGGAWAEGTNYVKFEDVEIDTPASRDANGPIAAYVGGGYLTDPNCVVLTYSNEIDGIQFASVKRRIMNTRGVPPNDANFTDGDWTAGTPITLKPVGPPASSKTNVFAGDYDVAFDTNLRNGEFTFDGPDVDLQSGKVHYIDNQEQWGYDFIIDSTTDGAYTIKFLVNLFWGNADFSVYIGDSLEIGRMTIEIKDGVDANIPYWSTDSTNVTSSPASGYLYLKFFQGFRTLKIKSNRLYFDFQGFQLWHTSDWPTLDNCEQVIAYGYGLDGDVNEDCYVNYEDLKGIVEDWGNCNDPCDCEIEDVW
jgi:hypothetical protein